MFQSKIPSLPYDAYRIPGLNRSAIDLLLQHPLHPAPFNMHYLVWEGIDSLPDATPDNWWKTFDPPVELAGACLTAVALDRDLRIALSGSPSEALLHWNKMQEEGMPSNWSLRFFRLVPGWLDVGRARLQEACSRNYLQRCLESKGTPWVLPADLVKVIQHGRPEPTHG